MALFAVDTEKRKILADGLLYVPNGFKKWSGSLDDISPLVLYEDNDMIVVFKPPSILVQQDVNSDEDNLLDAVKDYVSLSHLATREVGIIVPPEPVKKRSKLLSRNRIKEDVPEEESIHVNNIQEKLEPSNVYLIHRLDRPCSGVVVFAKTVSAASKLNLSFKNRLVDKNYVCMVNGKTEQKQSLHNMMQKTQGEKVNVFDITKAKDNYLVEAKLQFEALLVIQGGADINTKQTLIKVELDTGRKHQIRAQMAHIGHPIVGDVKYGAKQSFKLRDLALHAYSLTVTHPVTNKEMIFKAAPPSIWSKRFGPAVLKAVDALLI